MKKLEVTTSYFIYIFIAFMFVTHGRSLLFEYMINHGYEIKHHGIWSLIVWVTAITPLILTKYKVFCLAIIHYLIFHALIVTGYAPDIGKVISVIWVIAFSRLMWPTFKYVFR